MAQVEWYQGGSSANGFGAASLGENDFSYDAPSTSPGQFGTFEEEEPLLQGTSILLGLQTNYDCQISLA